MRQILVILILILGFLLRTANLSQLPPGFTPDEAAFGYNAYSLLETGRDEWGTPAHFLPFTNLRSFGDYKLPLYAFLAVPSVKLLGLNEFSVRIPNAIIGSIAVVGVFLLTTRIANLDPRLRVYIRRYHLALIASFLIAISPWHISLSRGAFEANLVTLFLPLGIYAFLSRRLISASILFTLSFYSYHTARLLTPLILLILLLYPPRSLPKLKWSILVTILCLPGLFSLIGAGSARTSDVSIFNPTDGWGAVSDRRFIARSSGLPDWTARIISNKITFTVTQLTNNYLSYFSPQFLFSDGAGEGTYGVMPGRGLLYILELPFLISFLILLIKKPSKVLGLLVIVLLLMPIPAAAAKGPGRAANRAVSMVPFLAIVSSLGFAFILEQSRSKLVYTQTSLVVILCFLATAYVAEYIYLSPHAIGSNMLYGAREAIERLTPISKKYDEVHVSRSLSEPHIYFAFYQKTPPKYYQEQAQSWLEFERKGFRFLDMYDGYYLGNIRFGDIKPQETFTRSTLLVGRPQDFPNQFPEYFHVDYPNGQTSIVVAPAKTQ